MRGSHSFTQRAPRGARPASQITFTDRAARAPVGVSIPHPKVFDPT
ncbi:hypothetical protein NY08_118 [Rhodococcus sp. B7740]|nr:hypothetical protein NY08_118 [Rhodococcus sp. B7740]